MDSFLANAERILEAAEASARANHAPGDWTILLGVRGEIEMVAGNEWNVEALRRDRGAAMAFRVGQAHGKVAVQGSMTGRQCRLETETPAAIARRLLGGPAAYTVYPPALPPATA